MLPSAFVHHGPAWHLTGGASSCARTLHPPPRQHSAAFGPRDPICFGASLPRVGGGRGLRGLSMTEFSVEGLQFIILTCGMLAVVSAATSNADLVMGISDALLGKEEEEEEEEEGKSAGVRRVRNPISGRMINQDGPTFRKLVRDGLLNDAAPYEVPASPRKAVALGGGVEWNEARRSLDWEFFPEANTANRALPKEAVVPLEGSVVALHYLARLNERNGAVFAASFDGPGPSQAKPFVFEVGDTRVIRALNEAVLTISEGSSGLLVVPPHLGFSPERREPQPPTAEGRRTLREACRDKSRAPVLLLDLRVVRVLPLPPALLNQNLSPSQLQERLALSPEGEPLAIRGDDLHLV